MGSYDEYRNYVLEEDDCLSQNTVQTHIVQTDDNYQMKFNKNNRGRQSVVTKYLDDLKMQDKGYRKVKRTINGKTTNVEIYSTTTNPQSYIRDAITGARYGNYFTGTNDENLFFKVRVCVGGKDYGSEPITLYYDNPEAYERNMGSTIKQAVKEEWNARRLSEIVSRS